MLRIIDTETCGLQGGIVEIASVDVIDGKIVNPMSHLVRPDRPISPQAMAIHRITEAMVADKPWIEDVIPHYYGSEWYVAHNASFDRRVLPEILFESITTLEKAVDTLIVNCITGITANRKHCKDLMESSAGIATALCPHIGYKASATIAKTAVKTGKSVRELVLDQGLMSEEELNQVLDPYLMTEVGEERKEDEARKKAC